MNVGNIIKILLLIIIAASCGSNGREVSNNDNLPPIFPDYTDVTIPVNIAPLNFMVEGFDRTEVNILGKNKSIKITTGNKVRIPLRKWRKILNENAGNDLTVTVTARSGGKWTKFKSFRFIVKDDSIDPWLVYRMISPGYEAYSYMGIYQRNITSFKENCIVSNRLFKNTCMNCHSFSSGDPRKMMLHLRGDVAGTLLDIDGTLTRLNTKTQETISNCIYPFWHPSGDYIAFSLNNISQVFHSVSDKRIEVFDSRSDIVVYDINNNKLITSQLISDENSFETFPAFSPDGKTLIFCSAPKDEQPVNYDKVKYSLCKITFDASSGTFGDKIDTLLSANQTGKSVSFPRVSPDGKYLIFTLSRYGNFSIWHRDADLYLLDLNDNSFRNIESINSPESDSYHSWSSDSHWMVFSSRRTDGLYTRPFITCFNDDKSFSKPFMLPQKDPEIYKESLLSFNVPEFITGKFQLDIRSLLKMVGSPAKDVNFELKEK